MKAVLASDYRRYESWLRETNTNPKDAFYVAMHWRLDGHVFDELVPYGTWHQRSDADLIREKQRYCYSARMASHPTK